MLRLREIAEGGTTTSKSSLGTAVLWTKDLDNVGTCPASMSFSLTLPATFLLEEVAYVRAHNVIFPAYF